MDRRELLKLSMIYMAGSSLGIYRNAFAKGVNSETLTGCFQPTWDSLTNRETPQWFKTAKFGIWAHWGPQCQPEAGDWYARNMYLEGSEQYQHHLTHFGHPSEVGFKDIIHQWTAEEWDPRTLLTKFKKAGAKYFVAMANHHDNFDLFDSEYQQEWNSTKIGPQRDIIGDWADAAKEIDIPFGVSVHASHAWTWYETAQRADTEGVFKGVPYDGTQTIEDGKGTWWEGLDPQDLYAQNHALSKGSLENDDMDLIWDWQNGAAPVTQKYISKFEKRTSALIKHYDPKLVYFDDTKLPFWPISDVGLDIVSQAYNQDSSDECAPDIVFNTKKLEGKERKALNYDIERGRADAILENPWQTCTCLGNWHYKRSIYENNAYVPAQEVIQMLIDVVSKNGNLLLSVPIRGNGTIDDKEERILEEIGNWLAANGACIYGTSPWHIFGEGPTVNKEEHMAYTDKDIRFTKTNECLNAIFMRGTASRFVEIEALKKSAANVSAVFFRESSKQLKFEQTEAGLVVDVSGIQSELSDMPFYLSVII